MSKDYSKINLQKLLYPFFSNSAGILSDCCSPSHSWFYAWLIRQRNGTYIFWVLIYAISFSEATLVVGLVKKRVLQKLIRRALGFWELVSTLALDSTSLAGNETDTNTMTYPEESIPRNWQKSLVSPPL